ncbi:MAG: hypothetical protein GY943_03845, partial [Chloroflexi bacterium]|nr:hypothetical protein [Chloroflexota bacterium]
MNTQIDSLWRKIEGEALFRYHRIVSRTLRWRFEGKANITKAKATKRPLLWAYWHEQTTPFIMYADAFEESNTFSVVMVGDYRSQILGRLGTRLGAKMFGIDMQGNPMASGRSLLRVIQSMKKGKQSMIAPDGPDGPPFESKGGVSFLARKAQAAVIPVGAYGDHASRLNRWDQYQIPLPFTKM